MNKEEMKEYQRQYYVKNKEDIKKRDERYFKDHREKILKRCKKYRDDNKKKIAERQKQYCLDNKEKIKEYGKQYYEDHREKCIERIKKYNKDNPEKIRRNKKRNDLKRYYGLSHEDWLKMWEGQDGKCAICGKTFIKHSEACVDHDHETGKNRGLLCLKCNFGIGNFDDDPELTTKATGYLRLIEEMP